MENRGRPLPADRADRDNAGACVCACACACVCARVCVRVCAADALAQTACKGCPCQLSATSAHLCSPVPAQPCAAQTIISRAHALTRRHASFLQPRRPRTALAQAGALTSSACAVSRRRARARHRQVDVLLPALPLPGREPLLLLRGPVTANSLGLSRVGRRAQNRLAALMNAHV